MKFTSTFFFLVIFMIGRSAFGQDVFSPFYVVIGGFKQEENAQRYCVYADEQNLPAVYAYNQERQIYYVYVRATQNKEVAYDILEKVKQGSVFRDAWVFNGSLSGDNGIIARNPPPKDEPQPEVVIAEPEVEKPEETSSVSTPVEETPPTEIPTPIGKPFYFKLVNGQTGDEVKGIIRLQENERATQYRGFNGNEKVYVPAPVNRAGKWIVVGRALGFRISKKSLVYAKADQLEGASVGADQEVIIPLQLVPVRKGDYIEMEGVKFFHNAALLTPGSDMELDQLVAVMHDNPGYQVRLHGHTNGSEDRDAVTIGTSTDFFNPNESNKKVHLSSKDLSLMRAELVKAYLVSKGIEGSRITTKGEGGKQMIFDPRGTLAGLNDRVEVEIRKH